jgi:hypothetical protein
VPAEDVMHVFIPEFAEQVRGVPWMYAALLNLVHLGAFEEAAVIAARIGASQMGFIESPDGGKTLAEWAARAPSTDGTVAGAGRSADQRRARRVPGAAAGLQSARAGTRNIRTPRSALHQGLPARHRGGRRRRLPQPLRRHGRRELLERAHRRARRARRLDDDPELHRRAPARRRLRRLAAHQRAHRRAALRSRAASTNTATVYWQARRWAWVDPAKEVNAAAAQGDRRRA